MKKLKKITCLLLAFSLVLISAILSACNIFKDESNNDDDTLLQLDGTSIVMSLTEAETLLSQAKASASGASLLSADLPSSEYSKADLLLIINQIKENMIDSTILSCSYDYDDNNELDSEMISDKGVVGNNLEYQYSVETNKTSERWVVKESDDLEGQFTEYEIVTENGQTTYTKRKIYEEDGVNIEQFCKGKFLFMISDLDFNETHIEGGYVHNNNLYIKLHVSQMPGESNANESFVIKNGRVVTDKFSFIEEDGGVELFFGVTQNYAWNEDADATLLERATNIPLNVTWQED